MIEKPQTADGYSPQNLKNMYSTSLYIATKLGDLMDDIVIVGGLVPSLIIDQKVDSHDYDRHVGTMDLDIGLAIALLDKDRYREISHRLRDAGFSPDENEQGKITFQRWKIEKPKKVTLDFLINPDPKTDKGGKILNLERDFAAIITPGLELAFKDQIQIELKGKTIFGEKAQRSVWVCGPGAYVVLKALAFAGRGENKDAYDLYYVIRNYGEGVEDVIEHLQPLLDHDKTKAALEILKQDFTEIDGTGPQRVARFIKGQLDDEIQRDVTVFIHRLINANQ